MVNWSLKELFEDIDLELGHLKVGDSILKESIVSN